MIRISAPMTSASATVRYYTHASGEGIGGYYAAEEKSHGTWHGELCQRLGIEPGKPVTKEAFTSLCENLHPVTGEQLTPKQQEVRRVAWDISFHPVKSVSILHMLTGDERIADAVERAAIATLKEMEREAQCRVRKGGQDHDRQTGELVAATFRHRTTRPAPMPGVPTDMSGLPDPHLHIHAVAMNVTFDPVEEQYKALQLGAIKQSASRAQTLFHANLARQLIDLGIKLERRTKGWEVAGIDAAMIRRFSRRTAEIERTADELGITDPEQKAALGARTRSKKQTDYTYEEMRQLWLDRITRQERERILAAARLGAEPVAAMTPTDALIYAAEHLFQRNSVMDEPTILNTALEYGIGAVTANELKRALDAQELLRYTDEHGTQWMTTNELLAEERSVIQWAKDGIGVCRSLGDANRQMTPDEKGRHLTPDQDKAARQILASTDRVTILAGVAGSGKTTMMRQVVDAIRESGVPLLALAPSAEASRGVLRDAGFKTADTVAMLLTSAKMQEGVKNGVIWIDEASLLGTQNLKQLIKVAERVNAKFLLSGDERQMSSPNRGDLLPLLRTYAGITPIGLTEILRQRNDYREAVKCFSRGNGVEGFDRLDKLGHIHQHEGAARFEHLAEKYTAETVIGRKVLAVAPTHAEGDIATAHIRQKLKDAHQIKGEERSIMYNRNLQWSNAEKTDRRNYEIGQKVFFHKPVSGMRCGSWWEVTATGSDIKMRDGRGIERVFKPEHGERFSVYQPRAIALASGDRVRCTQNITLPGGKRLNSGSVYMLEKFSPVDGALVLRNIDEKKGTRTFRVPVKTGLLTHGYVVTSHASQGKTVDTVLICQGSGSGAAASLQQGYVSMSRGTTQVEWYTDDKTHLRQSVSQERRRMSASELMEKIAIQRLREAMLQGRYVAIHQEMYQSRPRGRDYGPLQTIGERGLDRNRPASPPRNPYHGRSHER